MHPLLAALPARPPRPVWPHKAALRLACTALVAAVFGWMAVALGPDLYDEFRPMPGGAPVPASGVRASPGCDADRPASLFRRRLCTLAVRYEHDGRTHARDVAFLTLAEASSGPVYVHVNPRDPRHIRTSWGDDMLNDRVTVVFWATLALALFSRTARRDAARVYAAIRLRRPDARPVLAEVRDVSARGPLHAYALAWTDPATGHPRRGEALLDRRLTPFWADALRERAVAPAGGRRPCRGDAGRARTVRAARGTGTSGVGRGGARPRTRPGYLVSAPGRRGACPACACVPPPG